MSRHVIGIMFAEFFHEIVKLCFVGLFLLRGESTLDHDAPALPYESA